MVNIFGMVSGQDQQAFVATFQADGEESFKLYWDISDWFSLQFSNNSYVKIKGNLAEKELGNFTWCMRLNVFRVRGEHNYPLSYVTEISDNTIQAGKNGLN